MFNESLLTVGSFALRCRVSFIGGRPFVDVLRGTHSQIIFMFRPENSFSNLFFKYVRDCYPDLFEIRKLVYRNQEYISIFLNIPQRINKKFLFSFRNFSKKCNHLIYY